MKKISIMCLVVVMNMPVNAHYSKRFLEGLVTGILACVCVDFLRDNVLPDMSKHELHKKYGICRDQLTGQCKVAASVVGLAYLQDKGWQGNKDLYKRMAGIVAGLNLAAYLKKVVRKS